MKSVKENCRRAIFRSVAVVLIAVHVTFCGIALLENFLVWAIIHGATATVLFLLLTEPGGAR